MEFYFRDKHFLLEDDEELSTDIVDKDSSTDNDNSDILDVPALVLKMNAKPVDIDKQLSALILKGKGDGLNIIPYAKLIYNSTDDGSDSSNMGSSINNSSIVLKQDTVNNQLADETKLLTAITAEKMSKFTDSVINKIK